MEVPVGRGLPRVPLTAVLGIHESRSLHQRRPENRCKPRQSSSCPNRCRSDNEKAPTTSPPGLFANVQLKLPAVRAVAGHAPDLEGAELSNTGFEPHRHNRSLLAIHFERDLQRAEFLDIGAPVFQQAADVVLLTNAGTQEAKFGWFADDETKLSARNLCLGALLHAKGNDTERLERGFHAGHCRHGAFDSDVIRARGAAADTYAATATRLSIIGRAARNRVLQVGSFQDLLCPKHIESFFC